MLADLRAIACSAVVVPSSERLELLERYTPTYAQLPEAEFTTRYNPELGAHKGARVARYRIAPFFHIAAPLSQSFVEILGDCGDLGLPPMVAR